MTDQVRKILDCYRVARSATGGGFGSIIGRNSFRRDKADALHLLDEMVRIYQG
jgi:class I fructose-bisphosphate aldolase